MKAINSPPPRYNIFMRLALPWFPPLSQKLQAGVFVLAIVALVSAFYFSPIHAGDDWETFYGASRRVLSGTALYGSPITFSHFLNPPWLAVIAAPLALLPFRLGWAVLCAASLATLVLVARRWELGPAKTALGLASPAMFYILLHGQIDMLIITGVLLPCALWPLVALTKPQVAIGLALGVPRRYWIPAALVFLSVLGVSLLAFGNWPLALLRQPTPLTGNHNLWLGLWPFQVPAGIALILLGVSRKKESLLIAGSPFLFPYAATSSLIGPWLAASCFLTDRQAFLVWLSWWAAVVYRLGAIA